MFGADDNAGGFESHIQTMSAESTFRSGVRFGVEVDRVIGTSLHTRFTSDANGRVELDDAIRALIHRGDGTDAHARRVGAVIAARHLKAAAHIMICARFNILDPSAVHPQGHLILGLARGTARMASDTFTLVYQKSIIGHKAFHHGDTESRSFSFFLSVSPCLSGSEKCARCC